MSEPIYDIDERLYELYVEDCRQSKLTPTVRDFMVWCQQNDYDLPEVWEMPG